MSENIPTGGVGIPWFRPEDYDRLRNSIFVDGSLLHDTYAKWLKAAETGEKRFRSQGHVVERVYIDPEEFPKWCATRGLPVDGKARSQYAAVVVGEKYVGTPKS